jgi:hypothetical protein
MPRIPRIVIVDVAHYVTQRGNGRQFILATDAERMVYLDFPQHSLQRQRDGGSGQLPDVKPVHLVVVPGRDSPSLRVLTRRGTSRALRAL